MTDFFYLILSIGYYITGLVVFVLGFILVYRSLKRINLVMQEKFHVRDWVACLVFGLMFSISIVFALNITMDFLNIIDIPSISAYLLLIMLIILFLYPMWEIFELGKPTSDAVTDYHRWWEEKFIDKFKGKIAYVASLMVIIITYIAPITIITILFDLSPLLVIFMWCLFFPLIFLNYYAASGQMANILTWSYGTVSGISGYPSLETKETKIAMRIRQLLTLIVWIPFLMSFYSFLNPIITAFIQGDPGTRTELVAYFSLFTTVVFGIQGFFTRFWLRKSKTKIIDFLFAGYIMIAISVNMLISFINIDPLLVQDLFSIEILGQQPLAELGDILTRDYTIRLPLIVLQSFITISYGLSLLLHKESEFHSNIRLRTIDKAFGEKSEKRIIKTIKSDLLKEILRNNLVILKSAIIQPIYNKYGVDINENLRTKATQYLYLIALEEPHKAEDICKFLLKNTVEKEKSIKDPYISKEAFNVLGRIGLLYPEYVLESLFKGLTKSDTIIRKYTLYALAEIGKDSKNTARILDEISPLLKDHRISVRQTAVLTIAKMAMNLEEVSFVVDYLFNALDEKRQEGDLIESILSSIYKIAVNHPKEIEIDKILPFLDYSNPKVSEGIIDFIHLDALGITAFLINYYPDKAPIEKIKRFLDDDHYYLRYFACEALGNYLIYCKQDTADELLMILLEMSIKDSNLDVNAICVESIAEYFIATKNDRVRINGQSTSILQYYLDMLLSDNDKYAENASEALKSMVPLFDRNIIPNLESKLESSNPELVRDCLHALGQLPEKFYLEINLNHFYRLMSKKQLPSIKAEAVLALGKIGEHRNDVVLSQIFDLLYDDDPLVRLNAIFALGKIGKIREQEVIPILLKRLDEINIKERTNELELIIESLGIIGGVKISNEIIMTLQRIIIGDASVFSKDVVSRALYAIGIGMIKQKRSAEDILKNGTAFYDIIKWFKRTNRQDYKLGGIMMIFLEALQQKGLPGYIINIISDSCQDLLPYFMFLESKKRQFKYYDTLSKMLSQAYYSNYSHEILAVIDRIQSLRMFALYIEESNELLKKEYELFSKELTPDGTQFYQQGNLFLFLDFHKKVEYALKSYEFSIDLAPNEYFAPDSYLQIGQIYLKRGDTEKAKRYIQIAKRIFTSFDDISAMIKCEDLLNQIN